MANEQEMKTLTRLMADLVQATKVQNRILEDVSAKLGKLIPTKTVLLQSESTENVLEEPRKVYGWSMAASLQREGLLRDGDMKIEQDDSHWVWVNGTNWERVEPPSVQSHA